jgi:hypothetical protein
LIEVLRKGRIFNIDDHLILTTLILVFLAAGWGQLVLHLDNARLHECHDIFLFGHVSNPICVESPFYDMKNSLQEWSRHLMRSRLRRCGASSNTGWRNRNGFLRIMVTPIGNPNIR